jgi:hypothetical protein
MTQRKQQKQKTCLRFDRPVDEWNRLESSDQLGDDKDAKSIQWTKNVLTNSAGTTESTHKKR